MELHANHDIKNGKCPRRIRRLKFKRVIRFPLPKQFSVFHVHFVLSFYKLRIAPVRRIQPEPNGRATHYTYAHHGLRSNLFCLQFGHRFVIHFVYF